MVDRFSVSEIEVIRDAFSLFCVDSLHIERCSQLRCILRSLGIPITRENSQRYFDHAEKPIDMASLLDIVWKENNETEDPIDQVRAALTACTNGSEIVEAVDLARILATTGEKLTPQEIDNLFMQLSPNGKAIPTAVITQFLEDQLY